MSASVRRIALLLVSLALVLSTGRWLSLFLAERLWESTVSEAVAVAGARRALLGLSLEVLVLLLSAAWFVTHLTIASRVALPERAPPERPDARIWPARVPRWILLALALVLAVLEGGGAGAWVNDLLLALDGVRFGMTDPLAGVDLGFFIGKLPLLLTLQHLAMRLCWTGLIAVLTLHLAGGAIGITGRRIWISPKVRGHLAVLLAVFAVSLAWGAALDEYRFAAGLRGPLMPSEFFLRTRVSLIQTGMGAAAALASMLWWIRLRGGVVALSWVLFGLAMVAGQVLPLGTTATTRDEGWRSSARGLDSVAYALGDARGAPLALTVPAAGLVPTLWDQRTLPMAAELDSGGIAEAARGWIVAGRRLRPVWLVVRDTRDQPPVLLALADDQVSSSGGLLSWREGDSAAVPGLSTYREFPAHGLRPTSPAVDVSADARGVSLDSWTRRIVLAWALQVPAALSAPAGTHLGWRLDPAVRLRATAPFARWSQPRVRVSAGGIVWTSDGLLSSENFPSSTRIEWQGEVVSMVRPAFLGTVDAATGVVRIFRRSGSDSLAAAWARITGPLIEVPSAIPEDLRSGDPYPDELLIAQARAVAGPAWNAGRIEQDPEGREIFPPSAPGGTEFVVPFLEERSHRVAAFLLARRMPSGDSVRLIHVDSTSAVEASASLSKRWEKFPFQQGLRDSVRAAGGRFELGRIRRAIARDGLVAYQPAWAVSPGGRAQLVLVNVVLNGRVGTGRSLAEAWQNLRGEIGPVANGTSAEAILQEARRWMLRADSALRRGDLQELGRALAYLRDLLEPPKNRSAPP